MIASRDRLIAAVGAGLTGEQACAVIAREIARVAPYAAASVMTIDPDTHLPAGGIVAGFHASSCAPFWDNELLDPDFNKFNDLCDVRALLVPATTLLRTALGRCGPTSGAMAPTVVIVDADNRIVSMTEGAQEMLSELMTGQLSSGAALEGTGRHAIPGTILVALSRTRASRTSTHFTTRLRGRSGTWVQVHVAALDGEEGQIAVSIDQIRSSELIPLLLESYGLTHRETEIVLSLCRGLSTREISAELGISAHTVRDHLKSIFDKTHVTSRGELVAGLFTSHVLTGLDTHDHSAALVKANYGVGASRCLGADAVRRSPHRQRG